MTLLACHQREKILLGFCSKYLEPYPTSVVKVSKVPPLRINMFSEQVCIYEKDLEDTIVFFLFHNNVCPKPT